MDQEAEHYLEDVHQEDEEFGASSLESSNAAPRVDRHRERADRLDQARHFGEDKNRRGDLGALQYGSEDPGQEHRRRD